MKKRILSMMLAIVMVMGLLPTVSLTASATESQDETEYNWLYRNPTITTWTGSGTASDPYVIDTAQELADLAYLVNENIGFYNTAYYKLDADIDLSKGYDPSNGKELTWKPIGFYKSTYSVNRYFDGHFDGNNHTISNLTVSDASGYNALFGNVGFGASASISNLTLSNVSVTRNKAGYGAAALVGQCESLTISNCTVASGTITSSGPYTTGGLVASTTSSTVLTITNCVNKATIKSTTTDSNGTGGIVGRGYNESTLTISGCTNYGNVTGYLYVGGIIGNAAACTVTRCANYGDISATGTVNNTNVAKAAGILTNGPTQTILIENCYNAGTITSDGMTKDGSIVSGGAAGIAAFDKAQAGTIKNCHNVGTVKGTSGYGYSIAIRAKTIENCYYLYHTDVNNFDATQKTADEFADGTVYELLQGANTEQVWGQVLGTDSYPVIYNGSNKPNFHIHEWTYSLEGTDKIIATCSNTDGNCPDENQSGGFVTIAVPESLTYAGEPIEAVVTNVLVDTTTTVSVVYTAKDGSALTDGKPVNVGSYTAIITLGEAEISVEYEIAKASLTITPKSYILEIGSEKPDLAAAGAYTVEDAEGREVNDIVTGVQLAFASEPDMNKEGSYTIEVVNEEALIARYDENCVLSCVWGELKILTCIHDFTEYYLGTVNAENDSIFAKCSKDCEEYGAGGVVVTIYAPDNAVYDQGLYHNASLGYDSQVQLDSESIVYNNDPVNAGTYTASITYQGVTASVTYEVAKRPLTITADNKTVYVGDSAPEYTYTVSGWSSNHDEEDEFSHKVSGITTVCENANLNRVGTYAITISGTPVVLDSDGNDVSANYELTTQDGTLTVKMYYIPIIPSNPTYPPVVDEGDNGDVSVSPKNPEKGDTVVITPDPDEGYEVDEIIVTDKNGNPVTVIDNGDGTYSFVQPNGKVTIEIIFKEIEKVCPRDWTCPMYGYTDLDRSLWYHDGIHYCIEHGLMQGIGNNKFDPDGTTTRAMIVTILWRLEGSPVVNYAMDFEDVAADQWYTEAVRWAASEQIVEGYGNGKFGTNDAITREQLATILYRYEQSRGGGFKGLWSYRMDFVDLADVSDWAYEAMCWMNMNEVVTGKPGKLLDPKGSATRAEAAAMIQRYSDIMTNED